LLNITLMGFSANLKFLNRSVYILVIGFSKVNKSFLNKKQYLKIFLKVF